MPFERLVDAVDRSPWIPGAAPSIGRERLDERVSSRAASRRARRRRRRPCTVAHLGGDRLRVAAVLDEHVERLHHAGADAGRGEPLAAGDRVPRAGEVLQLRLVRR